MDPERQKYMKMSAELYEQAWKLATQALASEDVRWRDKVYLMKIIFQQRDAETRAVKSVEAEGAATGIPEIERVLRETAEEKMAELEVGSGEADEGALEPDE